MTRKVTYAPPPLDLDIRDLLATLAGKDDSLEALLYFAVARPLQKIHAAGGDWRREADAHDLRHVVDWLAGALVDWPAWLDRRDHRGFPLKVVKIGSVGQAVREADKAMNLAAQRSRHVVPHADDERTVAELADGYRLVEMRSREALDRETALMGHCIGNGSYDHAVRKDPSGLYSLRDANGAPHLTMRVIGEGSERGPRPFDAILTAFRGKRNSIPRRRYVDILLPHILAKNWRYDVPVRFMHGIIGMDGRHHAFDALPRDLAFEGCLDLRGSPLERLPEGMKVTVHLFLSGSLIRELPGNLRVSNSLVLLDSLVRYVPECTQARKVSVPPDLSVDIDENAAIDMVEIRPYEWMSVAEYRARRAARTAS